MKTIVAIDPGNSGALVALVPDPPDSDCFKVYVSKMPDTLRGICERFEAAKQNYGDMVAVMEEVGNHIEGDSASRSAGFARHVGRLEGILEALHIPVIPALPQKWMRAFPDRPRSLRKDEKDGKSKKEVKLINAERKRDRKKHILEKMQAVFPDVKVVLWNADALGIAYWYITTQLGATIKASVQPEPDAPKEKE